ncbi:peptidase family C50-domain-containing protein [Immersiella caudata]|uniref:separase n=1 Tax=Immersiella caudata TaxID=314043 RepID=A0AA40C3A9_9PEZI|nr:peptidase family C50-domain-containing protein [Immersiella caudata]
MDISAQADALRSATTAVSTCSPATSALLKSLLMPNDEPSQPMKAPRARANTAGAKKGNASVSADKELSAREKARLATQVVNALIKSLAEAAKPTPTPPSPTRQAAQDDELVKTATRNSSRRSLSAPATPLQPRSTNGLSSPSKHGRSTLKSKNTTGLLSAAECARVALAALRQIHATGKVSFPPLQLEMAMSSVVGKLVVLGLHDQAVKEARILKRRLEGAPAKPEATKAGKTFNAESKNTSQSLAELLDFGEAKVTGQELHLVVTTQVQMLQVLGTTNKPSSIEAALPYLRHTCKSSPINLISKLAEERSMDIGKLARLMERVAYHLLSVTPSHSSREDSIAQEIRLSVSPDAAFELQALALEARLHWWKLAKHKGDVNKDVLSPLAAYLSAFVRRTQSRGQTVYSKCHEIFTRLRPQFEDYQAISPKRSSSLASIYQTLATLAKENGQAPAAETWIQKIREGLCAKEDSIAKTCSVAAQLLALHLKNPAKFLRDDTLLDEVVSGIQGPLRGDSNELDELLTSVCAARRSAVNLLVALNKGGAGMDFVPSARTTGLLESLVLHCPRFCLRWLGKPPGPTSSTKDYLRYEQRRKLMQETIDHTLESAFMIIKTGLDQNRLGWEAMGTILGDCSTLLEYMGSFAAPDSTSSYYVKMSHFYYMQYYSLRQQSKDPKDPAPMRALRNSIECVKDRPAPEREKAQLLLKLEKMAEVCTTLGRKDQALAALHTIRETLVEDGVLKVIASALNTTPISTAWTRNEKAETLSRTLSSISKLEHPWVDWTANLSEAEQAAALEHRLYFILLRNGKNRDEITLQHPTVDSLLRTYIPTRFPVRRFRVLIDLLCSDIGNNDQSELLSVTRDASQVEERGQLGDDAGLQPYVAHMKAFYRSVTALTNSDMGTVEESILAWKVLAKSCQTKTELEGFIDDVAGLLDHLQSVADFLRMKGHDGLLATALELSADISHLAEGPAPGDLIQCKASLALQYSNLGRSSKAEQLFLATMEYVDTQAAASDAVASFHLAFAEHYVAIGNLKKAEEHLAQAQAAFDSDVSIKKSRPGQRKYVVIYALYLHSVIALERGDSHFALIYARESIKSLYQDWKKLESQQATGATPDTSMTGDTGLSSTSTGATKEILIQSPGPEFWKLFHVLYRNLLRVSAIYAHLGMFQETMYYAEQAQKLTKTANSELYNSHSAAWIASMFAKSASSFKSLELLQEAGDSLPDGGGSYLSAALACQISSLYLDLRNAEGANIMLAKAEAYLENLSWQTSQATNMAALEDRVAKLNIEDKPPVKSARRTVRQPAVKKTTRTAATTRAKVVTPKPAAVMEDTQISKLRVSILVQKAMSMLGRKEWNAARAVLGEALEASKTIGLVPNGQVAMAACLLGMSLEQMSQDPVFSVIQDSTISFPAVSCSVDKAAVDRHSATKASPPKKSRSAAVQGVSKEPTRAYVENLKEAQEYLLQAHSVATLSGEASLVHRISGMLQNIGLLLAATSVKARALTQSGHTSYSVELARNLTWRRERKAVVLEKHKPKFEGQDWPVPLHSAVPKRTSLGFTLDLFRFQKDYIDIIPKMWSVISLSLSENNHDLCITKLQSGHTPFVIRLPLERASSRDADTEVFNFQQGRTELLEIIKMANDSCHTAKDMTVKGAKSAWWQDRETLDLRLKDLLANIEQIWLGGFRGIFSQHTRRPELLARFQKSFLNILDKCLPSRRRVRGKKTKTAQTPVNLDSRILELFIGLGDTTGQDCDFEEELTDLLYFVVDILQFHGETNAYDEIDFDTMLVETFDALHSYHSAVKSSKAPNTGAHTILMLDKSLHVFPWESLPCLQGCAVSRMPSLACLRRLIQEQKTKRSSSTPVQNQQSDAAHGSTEGHHASFASGSYILNPSGDLKTTQSTFAKPLATHLPSSTWNQIVGRDPTEPEFESALADKDILLYFGHGSGAQYIRSRTVRNLERCRATVLLMGCSSARLNDAGEFEVYGPAWNYMMAGCPAVVGTLWDVTDRDIDRFAGRVFEEWGLVPVGTFDEENDKEKGKQKSVKDWGRGGKLPGVDEVVREKGVDNAGRVSLVEAVARARDACRFRYVTAAAVAVYGIPVYVEK